MHFLFVGGGPRRARDRGVHAAARDSAQLHVHRLRDARRARRDALAAARRASRSRCGRRSRASRSRGSCTASWPPLVRRCSSDLLHARPPTRSGRRTAGRSWIPESGRGEGGERRVGSAAIRRLARESRDCPGGGRTRIGGVHRRGISRGPNCAAFAGSWRTRGRMHSHGRIGGGARGDAAMIATAAGVLSRDEDPARRGARPNFPKLAPGVSGRAGGGAGPGRDAHRPALRRRDVRRVLPRSRHPAAGCQSRASGRGRTASRPRGSWSGSSPSW